MHKKFIRYFNPETKEGKQTAEALQKTRDIIKNNPEEICIICNDFSQNGLLCKNCYHKMLNYQDEFFNKEININENIDYYNNLKNSIIRNSNKTSIQKDIIKLFALAYYASLNFDYLPLIEKIKNDILEITNKKETKLIKNKSNINIFQQTNNEILRDEDSNTKILLRTIDGHKVKSRGEKIIDDILFTNRIPHAYSMTVAEIDTKIDRSIECDWFIPIIGSGKGIYIEYWGMDKQDYNDNKKEKTELYKKYELPLIQIEKDEIDDSQALNIRIRREINSLAKERYKTIVDF